MKIDLHGLNDRDRWPLSMDAYAIFPKKEEMDRACLKKGVLKLINRSKIGRFEYSLIFH